MSNREFIDYEIGQLGRLETEARAMVETARSENRDATDAEQRRFADIIAESARRKAQIAKLKAMDADAALDAELRARLVDRNSGRPDGGSDGPDQIRDMIQSHERQADFDLVRAHGEIRAIADFSDSSALYTSDFARLFAMYQRTDSPWFSLAQIVNADNGRPMVVPGLTADPTTYSPGEGTAITESTPTLSSKTITPVSYKWLGYVSWEAIEDTEYPLADRIASAAARAIALQFGSAATSTVLAGIANGGTATGLSGGGTATFVGYEDLLDLEYGRAAPYRLSGAWIMSNGMIKKARKFVDKNGQYLWQPAISAGQPETFDGRPVYEDPYLAAPASATKSALFGDWARCCVIKTTKLRVATSSDYRFNADQVAIKAVLRADIAVVDSIAAAYIVSSNT